MRERLFLCHRLPFPPNKGDKIRCWKIFRHLSDRGIQNKVLEAMAMGKVVVTTSPGLEDVDAEPVLQVRVADDPRAFAAAVRQAIASDEYAILGARARDLVIARHGWAGSRRRIEEIVDGCLVAA